MSGITWAVRRWLESLFCNHDYRWLVNLHGDPYQYYKSFRCFAQSIWKCEQCHKLRFKEKHYDANGYVVMTCGSTFEQDGVKVDAFEKEALGWIRNMKGESKFHMGELVVTTHDYVIENIEYNVIDAYRRLIRFPDPCPSCGRNGLDHDMECETDTWRGPDRSAFIKT